MDEAEEYFSEASALNSLFQRQFCEAQTCLVWGRMLAESTDADRRERGKGLVQQAHEAARRLGYAAVERRAAAELERRLSTT